MISTLVVDDEPLARRRLCHLLTAHDDIEVAASCESIQAAVSAVEQYQPDLIFLDIQMPEGNGFEIFNRLCESQVPAVVFVTAFSEYAAQAFDIEAVDYLLKPCDRDRLATSVARVRSFLNTRKERSVRPLKRIPIETAGRIRLIEVEEIDFVRADNGYLRIHAGSRTFLTRVSLAQLHQSLDPADFLRIHRSLIVRLDRVCEVEILRHGELRLTLADGQTLISGRAYRDRLRAALGLSI
ncbi:LytR/AlgR family response regulator transcription factor [Streptosporangium sp. NPDC000396]|uniref:LytR/AlgR family response regulator transcription factor n=1 Tax=Streptosporangium sp. NPDC000396 TaxID=3366185 RepID=UPI0036766B28